MKLKNYTSTTSVENSLAAIDSLLIQAGATHTARAYKEGRISALLFQLDVSGRPFSFKLPADPESVFKVLFAEIRKPQKDTKQRVMEQAERTAWAIVREWVHIQLSMIRMQQAEPLEVFLPYLYDHKTEKTFYSQLKDTGFKQLTSGEAK